MRVIDVCPSTLAEGFSTYSPHARRSLFDGRSVSHYLAMPPLSENGEATQDALRGVGRLSLSGVQPKFALIVDNADLKLRYVSEGERGEYILKPQPNSYHIINKEFCAANEHLTMQMASQAYGLETAVNALCFFKNDEAAYVTRRFDIQSGKKCRQEDFAALLGFTKVHGGSDFKYCNASYEDCAELIRKYVKPAAIDVARLFRLVLFNFITLNDDAHLKNFSLSDREGEFRLSPAYDLINTSLHLVQPRIFALDRGLFKEGMQMSDTRTICRADFVEFGRRIGLPERMVVREIDRFAVDNAVADMLIERSFISDELKKAYRAAMRYRCSRLTW